MILIDLPTKYKPYWYNLCDLALNSLYALDKYQKMWYIKYNPFRKKFPTEKYIKEIEEFLYTLSDKNDLDILVDVSTLLLVERICKSSLFEKE